MKHINKLFVFIALALALSVFLLPVAPEGSGESLIHKINRLLVSGETPTRVATLVLGGDVMLGRTVMTTSLDKQSPNYPFEKIASITNFADLVFVNLENPIIKNCPRDYESLKFCATPEMLEGLRFAGIDIVTLANNHSKNYGMSGFEETKKFLNENGIDYTGDNNLIIRDVNGIKFGFLGFDFLTNPPVDADYDLVHDSSLKVDVLIVGVHWGVEYESIPRESQKLIAKHLIESGADVIAGHHPHWVQTIDHMDGVPVYYSLGNFVFDQMWSENTKSGLLMKLTFTDGKLTKEEETHTYMSSWAQPAIVTE